VRLNWRDNHGPVYSKVNCFGHEAGRFHRRDFEAALAVSKLANHGDHYSLDEIGELPLELQPKLLRVLQGARVLSVLGLDAEPAHRCAG